jgi:hypothetical protein
VIRGWYECGLVRCPRWIGWACIVSVGLTRIRCSAYVGCRCQEVEVEGRRVLEV